MSIRSKLLALALAVLAVPYAGYEYLRELERHLRSSLETSLEDAARAIAGPLARHIDLFQQGTAAPEHNIYVHRLSHAMQIDGYDDDWQAYIGWSENAVAEGGIRFRYIAGRHDPWYYGLLKVEDAQLVYQRPDMPDALDNDHVTLVMSDHQGALRQYHFSPAAPGRLRPFSYSHYTDEYGLDHRATEYVTNIAGEWQPVPGGYHLEIAIPVAFAGSRAGIVVTDVDDPVARVPAASAGTARDQTMQRPGELTQPVPDLEELLAYSAGVKGRRLWALDGRGQVLASAGGLDKPLSTRGVGLVYSLILPPVHEKFADDLEGASTLQGSDVRAALRGKAEARWRATPDGRAIIVSAAAPVMQGSTVQGVVVVEESTGVLQMLQREAMISLFNKTMLVFVFVTGAILLFATAISWRLRRLRDAAEAATDEHGRVTGGFDASSAADEIGELSRSYAAMLDRLHAYNSYLESLAGKLSHELRTPLTVVRSSLEHLAGGVPPGEAPVFLERAREGVERLGLIVTRLSEATRLEQALAQSRKEEVDLGDLVRRCVEGYRLVYPEAKFKLDVPASPVAMKAAPELIEQMLDKLVSNAVDFAEPSSPIHLDVEAAGGGCTLRVANRGRPLPAGMEATLFDSMVSMREERGRVPHLGLGLYIVRLIAEFHGARVRAENLADGSGVRVSVEFAGAA